MKINIEWLKIGYGYLHFSKTVKKGIWSDSLFLVVGYNPISLDEVNLVIQAVTEKGYTFDGHISWRDIFVPATRIDEFHIAPMMGISGNVGHTTLQRFLDSWDGRVFNSHAWLEKHAPRTDGQDNTTVLWHNWPEVVCPASAIKQV